MREAGSVVCPQFPGVICQGPEPSPGSRGRKASCHLFPGTVCLAQKKASLPGRAAAPAAPRLGAAVDPEVARLRRANERLQHTLRLKREENRALHRMIATVGSTLDLKEVLRHVVEFATRAGNHPICFLYLWDKERQRLVLTSTPPEFETFVGQIELELGEGLTGWCALHRTTVMLPDQALADPRFKIYPELQEELFQSMMVVPIVSRSDILVGTITMATLAPHEFTQDDVDLMNNSASLVAAAIENARLYEDTRRRLEFFTTLFQLGQTISSRMELLDLLKALARLTAEAMQADLCAVLLNAPLAYGLEAVVTWPALAVGAAPEYFASQSHAPWADPSLDPAPRAFDLAAAGALGESMVSELRFASVASSPLIWAGQRLGYLNCYAVKARQFSAEELTLLMTIANQASLAVKNAQLVDLLSNKNLVRDFLQALRLGSYRSLVALERQALALGCDLSREHLVLEVEANPREGAASDESGYARARINAVEASQRDLGDLHPGSIFLASDSGLSALVRLKPGQSARSVQRGLGEICRRLGEEFGLALSCGISNSCLIPTDYPKGFEEALEALQIGQVVWGSGRAIQHADLGAHRYLYKLALSADVRSVFRDKLEVLAAYDRRRHTQLLRTLEVYLECLGNNALASGRLFVHRNTLVQRLDRVKALTGLDPSDVENWLTLQMELKILRFKSVGFEPGPLATPLPADEDV